MRVSDPAHARKRMCDINVMAVGEKRKGEGGADARYFERGWGCSTSAEETPIKAVDS